MARHLWTSFSAVPFFSGHPSHRRPSPVLLDIFLRLSPLQAVTRQVPTWTGAAGLHFRPVLAGLLSSFPAVTHPTADRPRCCLTFFFHCLLCRRSPIQVPTGTGAAGLHFRLSSFPAVTHPTDDRPRFCLTFFFHCLLCRRSPIQVPTFPGAAGLHPRLSRFPTVTHPTADRARCCLTFFFDCLLFMRSPIQVPTRTGAAGLHLRLSRFPAVTHPTADRARCYLTFFFDCLLFRRNSASAVPFFGGHPSHCRPSPVLLDFIFGCPVFRRSPIPLPTEPGAA